MRLLCVSTVGVPAWQQRAPNTPDCAAICEWCSVLSAQKGLELLRKHLHFPGHWHPRTARVGRVVSSCAPFCYALCSHALRPSTWRSRAVLSGRGPKRHNQAVQCVCTAVMESHTTLGFGLMPVCHDACLEALLVAVSHGAEQARAPRRKCCQRPRNDCDCNSLAHRLRGPC